MFWLEAEFMFALWEKSIEYLKCLAGLLHPFFIIHDLKKNHVIYLLCAGYCGGSSIVIIKHFGVKVHRKFPAHGKYSVSATFLYLKVFLTCNSHSTSLSSPLYSGFPWKLLTYKYNSLTAVKLYMLSTFLS